MMDAKDKWFTDRYGKFTSSENYKLLTGGKAGEFFGTGAKTYIKQKAIEKMTVFWENPKMEFVKPILHGKRYEQPAFDFYVERTGYTDMRYFGTESPIFLDWGEAPNDCGGSPDGFMGIGTEIYWGLELKCPENTSVHYDYLQMKDQHDLLDYCPEYYCQIQDLLDITKAKGWDFCSFDERWKDSKNRIKIIRVMPDLKFIGKLSLRKQQAIKERDKLLNQ